MYLSAFNQSFELVEKLLLIICSSMIKTFPSTELEAIPILVWTFFVYLLTNEMRTGEAGVAA